MRSTVLALAGSLLVAAGGTTLPAFAQPPVETSRDRTRAPALSPGDSSRILGAARNAQRRFEAVRRQHLPRSWSMRGGPCEEIIGRFCYWDDGPPDEDAVPDSIPAEAQRITGARLDLIASLDSANRALPGDDWIAAQLIRYLVEGGFYDRGVTHARACGGTPWWCKALEGMALHASASYAEADSVFSRALVMMPEAERCEWTDLTVLLADESGDRYGSMPCAERERLGERLWWLADPLFLHPGNDRRTEHFTRVVLDRLQRRTPSGYGLSWGDDIGELVARYGWPSYFASEIPRPFESGPPGILSHHRDPSYHFLPDGHAFDELSAIGEDRWRLRAPRQREHYAPPYATFATLSQLTTAFRRGDSILIISAYDVGRDTLMGPEPITAALIAARGPAPAPLIVSVVPDAPRRGTLRLLVPDTALIASIEIIGGDRVRRARLGIGLDDSLARRFRLSGLALFDPRATSSDSLPADLDALMAIGRSSATIRRDERVGLYWELYGAGESDDRLDTRVELVREGTSWLRRAGERIGLVSPAAALRLGWRDAPRNAGGINGRAVVIDLRSLEPGRYRVEVRVGSDGEIPAVAGRTIEIVR